MLNQQISTVLPTPVLPIAVANLILDRESHFPKSGFYQRSNSASEKPMLYYLTLCKDSNGLVCMLYFIFVYSHFFCVIRDQVFAIVVST